MAALSSVVAAGRTRAETPSIANLAPAGLQRGTPTEVEFQGAALGSNPRLFTSLPIQVEPPASVPEDGKSWKPRLTVPADTPLGVYPIRVQTDDGLSNPFLLAVGQVPNAAEVEPNNALEQAQPIALPVVVEGQIAGSDVDFFKFTGRQGQPILIEAWCARIGSGIDPQLRLTTAGRTFIAAEDDTPGLFTDARLILRLPADGEYVIEFSDSKYQAGGRASYRLTVGSLPAATEIYPLGGRRGETVGFELRGGTLLPDPQPAIAAARLLAPDGPFAIRPRITNQMLGLAGPSDPVYDVELPGPVEVGSIPELRESANRADPPVRGVAPVVFNGRLDAPGEEDRFLLAVTPGQVLKVHVHAADLSSALDGSLDIRNAANNQSIARADDTPVPGNGLPDQPRKPANATSLDPSVDVTVPGGVTELALVLHDLAGQGGTGFPYRIEVRPAVPTVFVHLAGDPQISIPRGGNVAIPLEVIRQGFSGPIVLGIANCPAGYSFRPGMVAEGQPVGVLSLSAAPDAGTDPAWLDIQATTPEDPEHPIAHAGKVVVFPQQGQPQGGIPSCTLPQTGLAMAAAQPRLITLETPAEPIEAVHGFTAAIPIKLQRSGDPAKGELKVQPLPLPPGITIGEGKIEPESLESTLTATIDLTTAVGRVGIAATATGKFQDRNQSFSTPVVTLDVVRPVSAELAAPRLEIKPGETHEVKGTIRRRGPFNQPVTLQINGLPAGLKGEPVTLPPESTEFVIKVSAEDSAAAAESNAQLAIATFKIGEKDYNAPPVPLAVKVVK